MAKTVIPMDDYEAPKYEDYTGDPPRAGWYNFELVDAAWIDEEEGTHRFTFRLVDHELYKGWVGSIRGDFDEKKWLSQMAAVAVRGSADIAKKTPLFIPSTDKEKAALLKSARRVRGQVIVRTSADGEGAAYYLQKVRPLVEDASAPKKTTPVVEEEPAEEAAPEDYTAAELEGKSLAELKKIMKDEFQATLEERKEIKNASAAVAWILEQQEPDEDEAEPEDDEEDEEELEDEELEADEDDDEDLEEFDEEEDEEDEPEPEPEPAPRRRATKAAPAKAAPAKAAATTRRRRA